MENNMENLKSDYVLSLYETCEILNKSSRTVSRYIRKGILHPLGIKSRQGTLEYRFSKNEIEAFKKEEDELRQVTYLPSGALSMAGQTRFTASGLKEQSTAVHLPYYIPQSQLETEGSEIKEEIKEEARTEETKKEAVEERQDNLSKPSQDKEIITLLKETTEILRDQLQVKDEQIKSLNGKIDNLIERDRETNILLKGMQDKMLQLEQPKEGQKTTKEELPQKEVSLREEKEVVSAQASKQETKTDAIKKDTQDPGIKNEKPDKQKKNKPVKQKKGFWGVFG